MFLVFFFQGSLSYVSLLATTEDADGELAVYGRYRVGLMNVTSEQAVCIEYRCPGYVYTPHPTLITTKLTVAVNTADDEKCTIR